MSPGCTCSLLISALDALVSCVRRQLVSLESTVISPSHMPSYTHLVNLVAQRSSLLLAGTTSGSQEYMSWVRTLEQDFDVRIEVKTIMGPDNRPSAIGGTITPSGACGTAVRPDCQLAFTVDGEETRCAVRYC